MTQNKRMVPRGSLTTASLVQRLLVTKLALLGFVMGVTGLVLLVVVNLPNSILVRGWLQPVPVKDVATALFSTALIVIAFEYINRRESEVRSEELVRSLFPAQAEAVVNHLLHELSESPFKVPGTLSEKTIDGIAVSCLASRFGDETLAKEVYLDLRRQVISTPERWRELRVDISLARDDSSPVTGSGAMLVATMRWDYRAKLGTSGFKFSCVSSGERYRELLRDPASTLVWYFERIGEIDGSSPGVFELFDFSVNGRPIEISADRSSATQSYSIDMASVSDLIGTDVRISYSYAVKVQRNSHVLQIDVAQPSRDLRVDLSYGYSGIKFVNVLDFIASTSQPRVVRTPAPAQAVSVSFDGWVLPKSGVAFVWVLDEEMVRLDSW